MSAPVFSFIVPTRRRTANLRCFLDSVRDTTDDLTALEVVLVVDQDDPESLGFQYEGVPIQRVPVAPGLAMGALCMAGYRAAAGQYLMLLNDDVVLRTPGWDRQVLSAFRSCPDGIVLVHVNDLLFRDLLCVFPFLTREFCALAGGICREDYRRYRIDDHIHNIFDLLSLLGHHRRIYLPEVVFEHTNLDAAAVGLAQYVPDPVIHELDTRLFDSLLAERKRVALEAMLRIDGRLHSEKCPTWEKKLDLVSDSIAIRHREHARFLPSAKAPRVTIGVVSADSRSAHARKCIELIKAFTTNYDLILMDNNGDPGFNHSREMNRIISLCATDYLVLMDDDVFVQPGWLEGMLRALAPGVGVVAPLHRDSRKELSFAGVVMCPDDSGHHTHILEAPADPRRIQTLCSAVMLIDMPKCGHIHLDERYTKYFLDIDFGLRIWEEGFQVVCSPYAEVTHLAGATMQHGGPRSDQLYREQRQRYVESWVDSGRIQTLRQAVWSAVPEIRWIEEKAGEIDRLIGQGSQQDHQTFFGNADRLLRSLEAYPALKDYIGPRALRYIQENRARLGDLEIGHLASLVESCGGAVLFESGFQGMNIVVLHNYLYCALPQGEGVFSYPRMLQNGYSRSFEAGSPEAVKALILEHRDAAPHGHIVQESRLAASAWRRIARKASIHPARPPAQPARDLAPDLARLRSQLAGLERRVARAESDTSGIYASRTWRALTGVAKMLRFSPRPRS